MGVELVQRWFYMRNSTLERRLYHDPLHPLSLGCMSCPDRNVCGGLPVSAPIFDCNAFCVCEDPATCRHVCRRDFKLFMARVREVNGFAFENTPRVKIFMAYACRRHPTRLQVVPRSTPKSFS